MTVQMVLLMMTVILTAGTLTRVCEAGLSNGLMTGLSTLLNWKPWVPGETQRGPVCKGKLEITHNFRCTHWNRKENRCDFRQRVVIPLSELNKAGMYI